MLSYKSLGFFASLLFNLKIFPDDKTESVMTNGIDIFINPTWFTGLNADSKVYVLLHATLHVALQHPSRMQGRQEKLWMAASDYTVNQALADYNVPIPQDALINPDYRGQTTEKIYEHLLELQKNGQEPPEPDHNDLTKPPINPGKDEGDSNKDDDSEGNSPQSSFKDMEDFQNKMDDLVNNAKVQSKMSDSFNPDGMPHEMQRILRDLEKPLMPWNKILARFLNQAAKNNYSWTKPNRRFLPMDIYLPSMSSEGLDRVDFIIDTSGSISEEDFSQFVTEIDKVLKQFKPESIGVSQFDHMYHGTEIVDATTDLRKLKIKGGGGTRIDSTLKAVSEMPSKCLIIFTDGYLDTSQLVEPKMPVVWAIYNNENFKEPFGKQIKCELKKRR